jgi:ParB family transcriptional regulator, chromosome partitioning protein
MARIDQAEALRGNRADSLARRPMSMAASSAGQISRQFEGRVKLASACELNIERLMPDPDQPRKTFPEDSIEQLAASFRSKGQLVPLLVRWSEAADRFIIIDGERRYRAALQTDLKALSCIVKDDAAPEDLLEIQLVTNALREDVLPVEQARSYQTLMTAKGYTHRELADRLNVSHVTVTRTLATLRLTPELQQLVDEGTLSPSTGAVIAGLDSPEDQTELAHEAIRGEATREEIAEKVRERKASKPRAGASKGQGRGAKGKPAKLPTERTVKTSVGIKLVASARKGFDSATLRAALVEALARVDDELAGEQAA